jgi:hypothetical protein
MHAKDAIKHTLDMSEMIIGSYVKDLDDADLLVRPVEGMNPIALQLGHLIASEREMVEGVRPGSCPPLPEGFREGHDIKTKGSDAGAKYLGKEEYLGLMKAQRTATRAVLDSLSESDLDAPAPERLRDFVPTVGGVFNVVGLHDLMHAGQFVGVRRLRKKPVAI